MTKPHIIIIGKGRVATHLACALAEAGANATCVSSRNPHPLPEGDLYIIAVSDDAIASVATVLGKVNAPVVHTSGTVHIDALGEHPYRGVFYPLQSFSIQRKPDFSRIAFCLEASDANALDAMKRCAEILHAPVRIMDSEQRGRLHFAAVVASNFCNHLWAMAESILGSGDALTILQPLIEETLAKASAIGAADAQTGPAMRHDFGTLAKQQKMANALNFPKASEIYRILSESICELHAKSREQSHGQAH